MTGVWHAGATMADISPLRRALTEPFRARTFAEIGWALLGLPLGIAGFVFTVVTLSVSSSLIVTFVGLPLLAVSGLVSRQVGAGIRGFANRVIGADIAPAQAFHARPGLFGWLASCLTDGTAWRARLYLLVKFPIGIAGFVTATTFLSYGLGAVSYPIWRPFLPCEHDSSGTCHRGASLGHNYFLDTPLRITGLLLLGLVVLFAAPWVVRGVVAVDKLAMRALLGPTAGTARVEQLERTRAAAVDDSAANLRRIERDLHDGAQAQLVSVAMNVGLAREKLAEGGDPAQATQLLDTAHATAKQAIAELRDLARGIHPPVLDAGLDAAIATLAAHNPVPVEVDVQITDRPEQSIETMVYFCTAELLTNVAKHSGATHSRVTARTAEGRLRVIVFDDGHGGARFGTGSGLIGLRERIATVDGRLDVDSPTGGPTTARVEVPLRAGSMR